MGKDVKKMKLSVVLATRNEEANIERCLESIKSIADEIIVVDEYSTDKTRDIAKKYNAKVYLEKHHDIFHITKQKALEKASGSWILQLDADEVVTKELSDEIFKVVNMTESELLEKISTITSKTGLFEKHQALIEERDGKVGRNNSEVVGFFIPRRNIFLGKPLIHAGVYPDGVIRLVKNGKAKFPQRSVHEQISLDGRVGWLQNDLDHYDSPTFKRYIDRANRYTDLTAAKFAADGTAKSLSRFLYYTFIKPAVVFLNLFFRHSGFLDGPRGFLWSFFSATHFPIAYFKYLTNESKS